MRAQSFWLVDRHDGRIFREDVPRPSNGHCVVKALYSAISPGTERLISAGDVPPLLHDEMRCPHMGGDFPFPVKYGYSVVGEVIAGPRELLRRKVHVLHPHQTVLLVDRKDLLVLPDDLPPARATLLSNLETAITAVWDSAVHIGDRVLVIGFGIIGSLVARVLSGIAGVQMFVADTDAVKRSWATKMGFAVCEPRVLSTDFDIAFNTSATAEGLQTGIDAVGTEGRVIELSWYGTRGVSLHLGETFHSRRKAIICSQVSTIPPSLSPRWNNLRRRQLAARLLADESFDAHIRHVVPFEELPAFFAHLRRASTRYLSVLVQYPR